MTPIYAELHRWKMTPFSWGHSDCVLVVLDWIDRVHSSDLAASVRYTYDDAPSCQRAWQWVTSPVKAMDQKLQEMGGLQKTDAPSAGDIAILPMEGRNSRRPIPTGSIWLGKAWGCKGLDGATTLHPSVVPPPLAIWSVGYEA